MSILESMKLTRKVQIHGTDYQNNLFWKMGVDNKQVGTASIRFLPHPDEDKLPFVEMLVHDIFKNYRRQRWFSLENIGESDPAQEIYKKLQGLKRYQEAQLFKAYKYFIHPIMVTCDPSDRHNEGKIFLYMCPGTIHERFVNFVIDNEMDDFIGCDFNIVSSGRKAGSKRYRESNFPVIQDDTIVPRHMLINLDWIHNKHNFFTREEIIARIEMLYPGWCS